MFGDGDSFHVVVMVRNELMVSVKVSVSERSKVIETKVVAQAEVQASLRFLLIFGFLLFRLGLFGLEVLLGLLRGSDEHQEAEN